jgi:predicted NBD/HSP70 family sugar kinase
MANTLAGATQDEVRRHNLGVLLGLLHVHGSASRSELTALTGLNRSTVGALTSELADAGLVRESAPVGRGGAGRPSILVQPESERVYVLALDVGVDHLTAARVGLGGAVLDRREIRQVRGEYQIGRILRQAERLARAVLASAEPDSVCVGVGASVCGVVRHSDGLVRFAPNLGWVDVPFGHQLAGRLGTTLPVVVGNDADLGALAEHARGAAVGARNVIFLSGEVGVGGGIILDGQPMAGAGGYGGEVGHMAVNPRGRLCRCGARGCWETEVGEDAVLAAAGRPDGTIAEVVAAAAAGDRQARAGLRRVGRWMGVGIANLVNVFNPEVVVMGGVLREVYPATEDLVRAQLATALAAPREQVELALPRLGADATLLGAAEIAFRPLIDDPLGALARGAETLRGRTRA